MAKHQLTEGQIKNLMQRYYEGENTRKLIDEFVLDLHPNTLTKIFLDVELEGISCPYCNVPLVLPPYPRSREQDLTKAFCKACGHKNSTRCDCLNCQDLLKKQNETKREEITKSLVDFRRPRRKEEINPENISLRSAIDLVGLCRSGLRENSYTIEPLVNLYDVFAYNFKDIESIHSRLYSEKLIDISVDATIDLMLNQYEPLEFNRDNLVWQLTIGKESKNDINILDSIEHLLKNKDLWPEHWQDELIPIWTDLALEEILLYLTQRLRDHRLEPNVGEKTQRIFLDLLKKHSISKIYNFIWGAVTNAVAYQVRKGLSRKHTVNLVPGNCQRRAEKALCEKWTIKEYRRDISVPISTRVSLFSNVVTNLGDNFFSAVPNIDLIA